MPTKKHIQPGEKVPLKLTATERTLVEELLCLDTEHEQVIRTTPSGQPVMMSLDELEDFGGYIAAEANHCENQKKQSKLDAIFEKIQDLQGKYTDDEPPKTVKMEEGGTATLISDQAVRIASWAAKALSAAEQLGIKKKPLQHFWLAPAQRDVLLLVPRISTAIKNKLAKESCLEGERACPPEDVGGFSGYEEFLVAIADPKHEEHASFLKWCGGSFAPDKFDPAQATRRMLKGLPDWRNDEDF